MNSQSLVSVIIPVYNREKYIAETIQSVLTQTYDSWEIIIVNDGSVDRSEEIALSFGEQIRYVSQTNQGIGAARNAGVRLAKGAFLAFLDSDDLWIPDKLTKQMAVLLGTPSLDMAFGYVQPFVSPELRNEERPAIRSATEIMPGYQAGTMLIRRDAFHQVGGFETNWELGEFLDWYARARDLGLKSFMLPEVVMKRRLHKSNLGSIKRDNRVDYVRVLKSVLDRRRMKAATREERVEEK